MAAETTPTRNGRQRGSERVRGSLRVLSMVTIPARDWDEAQIELATRRREAVALCDALEPRLLRLEPATYELGPAAHQLCAGALHAVRRYRARQG